jgi:hypothetical protein
VKGNELTAKLAGEQGGSTTTYTGTDGNFPQGKGDYLERMAVEGSRMFKLRILIERTMKNMGRRGVGLGR